MAVKYLAAILGGAFLAIGIYLLDDSFEHGILIGGAPNYIAMHVQMIQIIIGAAAMLGGSMFLCTAILILHRES